MSSEGPAALRLAAPLCHRIDDAATTARIAEALGDVFRDIGTALTPVIGARGVAALCRRSLHLTALAFPVLQGRTEGLGAGADTDTWVALLDPLPAPQAAACANHLLQTFHDLLVSLIGPSLSERLLRPAWGPPTEPAPSSGPPAQDLPP